MKREGMKKVLMPLNKDYLKNTTMNEYDEDQMILKHCEEVRSEVFKKYEGGDFDHGMMDSVIMKQIKLVGSKKMYDKVSKFNFGEPCFLEEKMKLFKWRKKFLGEFF